MMSLRRPVEQRLPYMKDSQSESEALALAGVAAQKLSKTRIETRIMISQLKALLLRAPASL